MSKNVNVRIASIGVYYPLYSMSNREFIEKGYGYKDKKHENEELLKLMDNTGKKRRRYTYDSTVIDMGVAAAKDAIINLAHASKSDSWNTSMAIDAVIFVTDTPEYTVPTNALFVHERLSLRSEILINDFNSNCDGMLNAITLMSNAMQYNPRLNRVLIIGAQKWFHYTDNPSLKCMFGDSACAVILDAGDYDNSYYIDSTSYTDSRALKKYMFPAGGLSNLNSKPDFAMMQTEFNVDSFGKMCIHISKIVEDNKIELNDISAYCISQFNKNLVTKLLGELYINVDRIPYIGDEYGYTGVTSPILALKHAIDNGLTKRGDYIVLWSVGSGMTSTALLLKY